MTLLLLACAPPTVDSGSPALAEPIALAGPDRLVELGQALELSAGDSQGAQFTWNFGDGVQAQGEQVSHVYSSPGIYSAVLTVLGENGASRSDALRVSVHLPLLDQAPQRSGRLWIQDGQAWLVAPEASVLSHIDLSTGALDETPVCDGPVGVARWHQQTAVLCHDALWVDGALTELPVGSRPAAVLGSEQGWILSLNGLGEIWRVGAQTQVLAELPDASALATIGQRVFVARLRSPARGGLVQELGGPEFVLRVDTRPDSDTTTGGVPNLLEQLVPSPDGATLYVPAMQSNDQRGLVLSGEDLSHETALVATVAMVDLAQGEDFARREQFDDKGRAIAAVTSPEGNLLYVLHPGTQSISVLDVWRGNLAGSLHEIGHGARDLWVVGDTLYVYAWLDRELRAYNVSDLTRPVESGRWTTLSEEPLQEQELLGKRLFWESLDTRITRDGYIACNNCHPDGREDGRTWDFTGRGEGLRNTISLEGRAGTGMGPVHWSGNFDEIQDFENDIRTHFAGTGLLSEADWAECKDPLGTPKAGRSTDLDALTAYVSSLDRPPVSPSPGSATGERVFQEAGCAECHPAPLYTDSALDNRHDVGTLSASSGGRLGGALDGLDTPTLLGCWDTAPYLHDGSAPSLTEAILAHEGVALEEGELVELVEFVRGR